MKALVTHVVIGRDEIVIMDMEAGIEHLGRATANSVDKLIVVVEPGKRSIETLLNIRQLADDIGINEIAVMANKVRNAREEAYILEQITDISFLGCLPYETIFIESDLAGQSPYENDTKAKEIVFNIAKKIIVFPIIIESIFKEGDLMIFLSIGARGNRVVELQQKLNSLRFPCGREDGYFGPATEAAVIAFQKSYNIVYDGIAGPETLASLDMLNDEEIRAAKENHPIFNALKSITSEKVSKLFPLASVRTIDAHFPIVKEALIEKQLTDLKSVVFALSIISAVSTSFNVHEETVTRLNTSPGGIPFDLYDNRRDLGNSGHPDGERFKSRGFCIFRGRLQYQRLSAMTDTSEPLIEAPEQVTKVSTASKILSNLIYDQEKNIKCALLQNNLQSAYLFVTQDIEGFDRFRATYRQGMLIWG